MSKKIQLDVFDEKSINNAIAELEAYKQEVESKTEAFLDVASSMMTEEALLNYSASEKDGLSDSSVSVNASTPEKGKRRVTAEGRSVLFLEFGTGITKSDSPSARGDLTSGEVVGHGEYGLKHGANEKGWHYNGKHTFGINAQTPMYSAKKTVQQKMDDIAKEVFGK